MFGGIFLNEQKLEEFSERVQDYVFLHEYGHSRLHLLIRLLSVAAQIVITVLTLLIAVSVPTLWVFGIIQFGLSQELIVYIIGSSLVLGLAIISLIIVRWLDEGYAELFAASKLGVSEYTEVRNEIYNKRSSSSIRGIIFFIRYPPTRLVVYFARQKDPNV